MASRRTASAAVAAMLGLLGATVGCTGDGGAAGDTEPAAVVTATTVAPADLGPFCSGMLALDAEDAADMSLADLVEAYERISPDVPAEIRSEFDAVLDRMRVRAAGDADEAELPAVAEEAAYQLSFYVENNCRGTAFNPLPPATSPGVSVGDADL